MIPSIAIPLYKNESIFSITYELFGGDINVKNDLSNYATKAYIKNILPIDIQVLHLNQI